MMDNLPLTYCIRTHAGLESHVADDLSKFLEIEVIKQSHRTLFISSQEPIEKFLHLKSIDDVFILVGNFYDLSNKRDSLDTMRSQALSFPINEYVNLCALNRKIDLEKGFSITASFVGKRNYNRWEIADALREAFSKKLSSQYLDTNNKSLPDHDIHFRAHLDDDVGWCGIRLSKAPLSKRGYKRVHLEGSLAPQIAHMMVKFVRPAFGDVLIDPMCGAGTIVHESSSFEGIQSIGVDISPQALMASHENRPTRSRASLFMLGDARNLPFKDSSINCIVCDMPWGVQTDLKNEIGRSMQLDYYVLLDEFRRVLSQNGRMVLLTEQKDLFEDAIKDVELSIRDTTLVSVFGKQPTLYVLHVE